MLRAPRTISNSEIDLTNSRAAMLLVELVRRRRQLLETFEPRTWDPAHEREADELAMRLANDPDADLSDAPAEAVSILGTRIGAAILRMESAPGVALCTVHPRWSEKHMLSFILLTEIHGARVVAT